jgi:hypothetical protein
MQLVVSARRCRTLIAAGVILGAVMPAPRWAIGGMTWPLPRRRPPANGDRKQRHGSGQLRDCMQYGATEWA